MPPAQRYQKDEILRAATVLIRRDGPAALNARSLARELGCSTQPIFRLFTGMDELRSGVISQASDTFYATMYARMDKSENPYLEMGLHYLTFAQDDPQLFKLIFMRDRMTDGCYAEEQAAYDALYVRISQTLGISVQDAQDFYCRTWVYAHGLAVSIATKYTPRMSEVDMVSYLRDCCRAAAMFMHLSIPM